MIKKKKLPVRTLRKLDTPEALEQRAHHLPVNKKTLPWFLRRGFYDCWWSSPTISFFAVDPIGALPHGRIAGLWYAPGTRGLGNTALPACIVLPTGHAPRMSSAALRRPGSMLPSVLAAHLVGHRLLGATYFYPYEYC